MHTCSPTSASATVVAVRHEQLLERLGLCSLVGARTFRAELVKNHKGRRDISRVQVQGPEGIVLFVKRTWKPYRKNGLASLLRRGTVWSASRQEWENGQLLRAAGLRTAGLVAYGEDCGRLWERFSFLVTEAATGSQTVRQFLECCSDRGERRRVLDALAREVRRMHDAGLASPDLFTRHVFVNLEADPPQFCWIDMARLDRVQPLPARLRARDLAALNVSAPIRFVSARERVRFLEVYAGSVDRQLAQGVARRMAHLLTHRSCQDFLVPPHGKLAGSASSK